MSEGNKKVRDWQADPKAAYEYVFNTHFWGNRNNVGDYYTRKGGKTKA